MNLIKSIKEERKMSNSIIGAIIGDIVGSRFEFHHNPKIKEFELFHEYCEYTDDSLMTLAVACAVIKSKKKVEELPMLAQKFMRLIGRRYPSPCGGYGSMFYAWLQTSNPRPYGSFGNGAAMRVSACGEVAKSIEEAKALSAAVTGVTHNHPEGLKGAEATAVSIYMAKQGEKKETIKEYVQRHYYEIDFTLADIRNSYQFDGSCQGTVPQALQAFFESTSFEDAIRNAISIGGDSDTIGAITGSVAGAYYGVPMEFHRRALDFLTKELIELLEQIEKRIDRV